jgi:Family of unknown function (DUF6093)
VTFPPGVAVYTGKCRIRGSSGRALQADTTNVGAVQFFTTDYMIAVPFNVTTVKEGHVLTVSASPDPALVGIVVEVQHVERGEHISARRLICKDVA